MFYVVVIYILIMPFRHFFFKGRLSRSTKILISTSIIFFMIAEIMTSIYLLEIYKGVSK